MKGILLFAIITLLLPCCNQEKRKDPLAGGTILGQVSERLEEASGLAASATNQGMLWTVNDSGNPPDVFLIDLHANIKLVCHLTNIRNRDWEDIAVGGGPIPGKNYVYVADIGDNLAQYEFKYIYRFEEPRVGADSSITITQFDTLILKMPDGKRDTETILIDPLTTDLYLISKREQSVGLYATPSPLSRDTITLRKVLTMPFTQIVGGNISADGMEVLIKNYEKVFYWKRSPGESLPDLLAKAPIELPYERERQGEAIAWSRDGSDFYTLSERSKEVRGSLIVYKGER